MTIEGDKALAQHLPLSVRVTYTTETVPFGVYFERHPCMFLFIFLFFPLIIFHPFCPCLGCEDDVEESMSERKGRAL